MGVLGITDEVPRRIRSVLGDRLVAAIRPEGVRTTLDLLTERGRSAVEQAALRLKSDGADIILLAFTGLSTIGAAAAVRAATGLRVIDPVKAEGFLTHFACSLGEG